MPKEKGIREAPISKNKSKLRRHKSVANFDVALLEWETSNYIIRIDKLDNKKIQYASWKKPNTFSDKPDLVIEGGNRYRHGTMGSFSYYFKNGQYTYSLNYTIAESTSCSLEVKQEETKLLYEKAIAGKGPHCFRN